MFIYLDFDGTVVEHAYPDTGRCNFGCVEVIKKLQDSGHDIVLNTMRSELDPDSLKKAIRWFENSWMFFKDRDFDQELSPIKVSQTKIHPHPWERPTESTKTIFIDDIATGIPLKRASMINNNMVDWDKVEKDLIEWGIIK